MEKYYSLLEDNSLLLLQDDKIIFSSKEKGVKPLLDYYHAFGSSKEELIVIDKIMGRGAILLAQLVNARTVYTPIISQDALNLANEYHMNIHYQQVVPYIINNQATGRCPIESSVLNISDVNIGYEVIIETLKRLKNNS